MGDDIAPRRIRNRKVFYVMGFDPRGISFYYAQLKREARISYKRGFSSLQVGPLKQAWEHGHECQCHTEPSADHGINVSYHFLSISDFVTAHFELPLTLRVFQSLKLYAFGIFSGLVCKLIVSTPKFALFTLYPLLMLLIAPLLGLLAGTFIAAASGAVFAVLIGLTVTLVSGLLLVWHEHRSYVMYLLGDFLFSSKALTRPSRALGERMSAFASQIFDALQVCGEDEEVLIVGHSSGALLAIQLAAAVTRAHPREGRQRLSLLTLGNQASLAYLRGAERFRQDIAELIQSDNLTWYEIYAPQDVISSGRFDLSSRLSLGSSPSTGYRLLSARFKEVLTPTTYQRQKHSFLKLHMQYLRASETGRGFNYITVLESPVPLRDFVF